MDNELVSCYYTESINNISYFSFLYDIFIKKNHVYNELIRITNSKYTTINGEIRKLTLKPYSKRFVKTLYLEDALELRLYYFIDRTVIMTMKYDEYKKLYYYMSDLNQKWFDIIKNNPYIKNFNTVSSLVFAC